MNTSSNYLLATLILGHAVSLYSMSEPKSISNLDTEVISAATQGNLEKLKWLQREGANFNAVDSTHKATALFWVIGKCSGEARRKCVTFLVEETNININARNTNKSTALELAAHLRDFDTMRYLLTKPNIIVSTEENGGCLQLLSALHNREFALASTLLESNERHKRVEVEISSFGFISKLSEEDRAKIPGYPLDQELCDTLRFEPEVPCVKRLLKKGASPHASCRENNGCTALSYAIGTGDQKIVKELLSAGASVSQAVDRAKRLYDTQRRTQMLSFLASLTDEAVTDIDLHSVAANGDATMMRKLVAKGAQVNVRNQAGVTPLDWACQEGHTEVARILLDAGANINEDERVGFLPLFLATMENQKDCVELLLSNGASTHTRKQGYLPLHIAAQLGHCSIIELLLSKGASVNVRAADSCMSLHLATQEGHKEVVKLLIKKGADLDATIGHKKITAYCLAIQKRHEEVAEILREAGASIHLKEGDGYSALHFAAQKGLKGTVERLIEHGLNVNERAGNKEVPLHNATHHGHFEVVKILLEKGADVNAEDADGVTALYLAVILGHRDILHELLARKADTNRGKEGETPLHHAIKNGYTDIAEVLLENGANPNACAAGDVTPLHVAVGNGYTKLVTLLLSKGAHVDALLAQGRITPLWLAVDKEKKQCVELLLEAKAQATIQDDNEWSPLHVAAKNGSAGIARLLIAHGADVQCANNKGYAPLQVAAEEGYTQVVEILLSHDASVNAESGKAGAALQLASQGGHLSVVRFLIEQGAEVDSADGEVGFTPLRSAVQQGHYAVAELLIEHGADVNAKDTRKVNSCILHGAAEAGRSDIISLLLSKGADIHQGDVTQTTALHYACLNGADEVVRILLEADAQPNVQDLVKRIAPLHVAAVTGSQKSVEHLLAFGADVSLKMVDETTALDFALRKGHTVIAELLLAKQKEASKNVESLLTASLTGQRAIIEQLLYCPRP